MTQQCQHAIDAVLDQVEASRGKVEPANPLKSEFKPLALPGGKSFLPRIVTDSREQLPLIFPRLESVAGSLYSGDYTVENLEAHFAVERKSIADLVGSLTSGRERFMNECARLQGFKFRRLLIIGEPEHITAARYRSGADPRSIWGSLLAVEQRYGLPVVWGGNEDKAARTLECWAFYAAREAVKGWAEISRRAA